VTGSLPDLVISTIPFSISTVPPLIAPDLPVTDARVLAVTQRRLAGMAFTQTVTAAAGRTSLAGSSRHSTIVWSAPNFKRLFRFLAIVGGEPDEWDHHHDRLPRARSCDPGCDNQIIWYTQFPK
jgi:hypothetical protein